MSCKYAFIDEFGAFGFDLDNKDVATHYIICATIVEDQHVEELQNKLEKIRSLNFQKGEMKSSFIGKNHNRRRRVLAEFLPLPFNVFILVVDKTKIADNGGLRYMGSFYKYLNEKVYEELRLCFKELIIVADQINRNSFKESFYAYVQKKQHKQKTLFGEEYNESDIQIVDSKNSVINQLSDVIAGSLAYDFDIHKRELADGISYKSMLESKILRIVHFPELYDSFSFEKSRVPELYDREIAETCFRKAVNFIETHKDHDGLDVKQQIIVLKYLLFRFTDNPRRSYIPTMELIGQLVFSGYEKMSIQSFRNKIIAPLRDSEVILASCKKGYKIPTNENELCDFVNHGKSIILPMLSRLRTCNDVIKMGTNGRLHLFDRAEYSELKELLDDNS